MIILWYLLIGFIAGICSQGYEHWKSKYRIWTDSKVGPWDLWKTKIFCITILWGLIAGYYLWQAFKQVAFYLRGFPFAMEATICVLALLVYL